MSAGQQVGVMAGTTARHRPARLFIVYAMLDVDTPISAIRRQRAPRHDATDAAAAGAATPPQMIV